MTKALYKIAPIGIVFKDRFALYSTNNDMMQGTWGIYAGFSRHDVCLSDLKYNVNIEIERTSPSSLLGSNAHDLLGFLYATVGQLDLAIAECQKAVELDPNSATARTFYGIVLNKTGPFEEAVHELEQGLRLDPFSSSFSLRSLALAYCNIGRYEEAIKICKKAIQKAPNDLIAHIIFIQAYSLAGQQEEARKEAAEVLKINPNFSLESYAKRLGYKYQADTDRVVATLRAAGLK